MVKPEWSRRDNTVPPWLLLAEPEEPNNESESESESSCRKVLSISKNKCYKMMVPEITEKRCWGSSYGWIVMQDFGKNVTLFNPVTKAQLSLPSIFELPRYTDNFDSDDEEEEEEEELDDDTQIDIMENYKWVMKVLVFKSFVLKIMDELVVFVIHYPIDSLAFARPGDNAWTEVVSPWGLSFIHHVMVMDEKVVNLYTKPSDIMNVYFNVTSIIANSNNQNNNNLIKAKSYVTTPYDLFGGIWMEYIANQGEMYMVELAGDLLVVLRQRESGVVDGDNGENVYLWDNRDCYRTVNFEVYKHVDNTTSSEKVEDLGDYLFFIGDNYATVAHISKAPNCQKNAIYFIDDESRTYWGVSYATEVRGHDMGMFDMASGEIRSFYQGGDKISKYFAPIWFMPNF